MLNRAFSVAFLMALSGCGGQSPSTTAPSQPERFAVSGRVVNRIDGANVTGAVIEFSGPEVKTATVSGGQYQLSELLAGGYRVRITGGGIEAHETTVVNVAGNNAGALSFSVLGMNSGRPGTALYNEEFKTYFDYLARAAYLAPSGAVPGGVLKWDPAVTPLKEYYINPTGLSPAAASRFESIFRRVIGEQYPNIHCGNAYQGTITVSETDIGRGKVGTLIVHFIPGNQAGAGISRNRGNAIESMDAPFGTELIENTSDQVISALILHEVLGHGAGWADLYVVPDVAFRRRYIEDMMMTGGITQPTPENMLAGCIIEHAQTRPGNTTPDTNPDYVSLP